MKQQIKCPHCNKEFSIEQIVQHENEEFRKKLEKQEQQKAKEKQKELEDKLNLKLEKEKEAHQKQLEKIKSDAEKKQKEEIEKQSAAEIEKIKKTANDYLKKQRAEFEIKAKQDQDKEREKLEAIIAEKEKAHQIDLERMRRKTEEAARAASQSPSERKGETREELLEEFLKREFPMDNFTPVKKGQRGADVIQSVIIKGDTIGNILHESKDVINFDEKWVQKLLDDMGKVNATVGFIFTKAMPKKSKGFVEDREGGRVIICSEYPILKQLVSFTRKIIQSDRTNISNSGDEISSKLKNLFNYLNSNDFKIQTRKIFNGIKRDNEQIDKDERSFDNQIKNRKKNLDESKKNINNVVTSLISNADLPEDLLDINDDNFLIE
jgi:hypothetical protein